MGMGIAPKPIDQSSEPYWVALNLFRFGSQEERAAFEAQFQPQRAAEYVKLSNQYEEDWYARKLDPIASLKRTNYICNDCTCRSHSQHSSPTNLAFDSKHARNSVLNIIDEDGRRPDDAHVKRLLQFRHPTNKDELRAYLGAVQWLSNHVYNMKDVLDPFAPLLKDKVPWRWTNDHQQAFLKAQTLIKNAEILHHPDFDEPFYLKIFNLAKQNNKKA